MKVDTSKTSYASGTSMAAMMHNVDKLYKAELDKTAEQKSEETTEEKTEEE